MLDIGLSSAIASLGLSEGLEQELVAFLTESAGELADSTPEQVGNGVFGQSPASLRCSSDAGKAREHVADAILDIAAGLKGYGAIVKRLHVEVAEVEGTTQADMARLTAQAEACMPPSFAAPSQCGLPGSSTDGDS